MKFPSQMTLIAGRRLGSYEVLGPIGAGGMGEVHKAHDSKLGRDVALKVLPETFSHDKERLARFKREAHLLASLNHPNIATIHGLETADGIEFLVLELVDGETLAERIERGPIPIDEALTLFQQIVEALEAAHAKGIVHRDLKPSNIKITPEGRVKVLDFGLAKEFVRSVPGDDLSQAPTVARDGTRAGVILGTTAYMSPEQARGKTVDNRTDIWAFGCCLYECLTGKPPFLGETVPDTMARILEREPDFEELTDRTPAFVRELLHQCLQKDPARRHQDVADVRFAIEEARTSRAIFGATGALRRRVLWAATVVVAVVVAIALGFRLAREPAAPEPDAVAVEELAERDPHSIAVLPFVDMSPGRDQEYFSDGLAEELLNTLVQIRDLKVVGRTSSFQFKGKNEDLRSIGEKLNVAMILEGSVRKANGQARITAQLVSASDGFHVWSETYDTELNDIFAVQETIARSVAEAIRGPLLGEAAEAIRPQGESAEAYNLYLQGRHFARRNKEEDIRRGIALFQDALALDPDYTLAWVGLANTYRLLGGRGFAPVEDAHTKALAAVEKALELDDTLAEGWTALGIIKSAFDWDWVGADAAYQRAVELNPGNVEVLRRAGSLAANLGRYEEAVRMTQQALDLDPLAPYTRADLGIILSNAHRLEEAESVLLDELELYPDLPMTHSILGLVYLTLGRAEAAVEQMELESDPGFQLQGLALAQWALGEHEQADEDLAELVERYQTDGAFQIAEVYAYRGEFDEAFTWLERAYLQRDTGLAQMKTDWLLTNLHDDPRWTEFLEKMGLAD